MTYDLSFVPSAQKEWKKLDPTLAQRLENPHVSKDRLSGRFNLYKIKLRSSGYRLVYEIDDNKLILLVLAVGKRNKNEVYIRAAQR